MEYVSTMNPLGLLVQRRLAERGWSYGDVARLGGLPKSTVYKLATTEHWTNAPQVETLDRLARGLGLPSNVVRKAASEAVGLTAVVEEDPALGMLVGSIEALTSEQRAQITALVDAMTRGSAQ
jgi:transcriptional regulator with XRE-family HTH domain